MSEQEIQGEPLSLSIEGFASPDAGYMLESAISATAAAANESEGRTQMILDAHLQDLCGIQLSHIHDLVKGEHKRDEPDQAPQSTE